MSKRHAWIAAVLVLASCTSPAKRDCERTSDCASDEFCRMGFCVPAVTRDDTSMRKAQSDTQTATTRPPRDTGGRSASDTDQPIDGGGRDIDRCDGRPPGPEDLVVNEILIDVPGGDAGDANGDGTRDAFADEFVEVVSRTDDRLDLSGVELLEGGKVASTLGRTCLAPRSAVVVFGGGSVEGLSTSDVDALFRTADGRLGLPNSGGTFAIRGDGGARLAEIQWNGPPSESLTLQPQITGTSLKPHSTVAPGQKISPGRCADGSKLTNGCPEANGPDAGDAGDANRGDSEL